MGVHQAENAEQDWDGGDQREQCGDAGGQGPHLEDFELLSHFGPDWVLQQPRIIISGFPLSGPDLIHRPPYAVLPRSLKSQMYLYFVLNKSRFKKKKKKKKKKS